MPIIVGLNRKTLVWGLGVVGLAFTLFLGCGGSDGSSRYPGFWKLYRDSLGKARYIDLTHAATPSMPVWRGFGKSTFSPSLDPKTGRPFTYGRDGFEATSYGLATDHFGTQLDPPAHWAPEYPAIDELPPTFSLRPLVVLSIVPEVAKDPGYALRVSDIRKFEAEHGRIPPGSVVMIRSDWSKKWTDDPVAARMLADDRTFPQVSLEAVKYLHLERDILFHGHEPLDTDSTPRLDAERWLLQNGYTQAEGVTNLEQVPATGCLISIGFAKLRGGLGGYARYVAICPPNSTSAGETVSEEDAPLPAYDEILRWNDRLGYRVR